MTFDNWWEESGRRLIGDNHASKLAAEYAWEAGIYEGVARANSLVSDTQKRIEDALIDNWAGGVEDLYLTLGGMYSREELQRRSRSQ